MAVRSIGTLALAALSSIAACGTDAVGVETCRQIEQARCQQAPACGIALDTPNHVSGSDVSACIRYYDDACLHGLANGSDPGPHQTGLCVSAIKTNGCDVVLHPEIDPACAWLIPIGSDAAVAEASASADGTSE